MQIGYFNKLIKIKKETEKKKKRRGSNDCGVWVSGRGRTR